MCPSISVITPSYNQSKFIERTILSVLDQGVADLEYVIFDADSKDNTLEILKKYDNYIQWTSEPDRGQSDAVNKGIRATRGEIIAWLNSDDVYLKNALNIVMDYFEKHPETDLLYGDAWYINTNDHKTGPYLTEPWDFNRFKEVCFICQPAAFFRRRVIEQFGALNTDLQYCMDYEFWLRLAQGGAKIAYLPIHLASSRLYAENKTLGQKMSVHIEINNMLKDKLGYVPDSWLFSYADHVTHTTGFSRQVDERRFLREIAFQSWRAALQWNQRISFRMMLLTAKWLAGAFL